MKAQDIMDQNNERAEMVRQLQAFCDMHGWSYSYTEKFFRIKLSPVEPLPVKPLGRVKQPDFLDTSKWGPAGPVEGSDEDIFPKAPGDLNLPDELPPTTTPLDEGKPPEGDDEA